MIFRKAEMKDIAQIQLVRNAVKENVLSDPARVTDADCAAYLTQRGKGWVCDIENVIVGFSVADLQEDNIWALFVHPDHEGKGIGKTLHDLMLDWYFSQGKEQVWLSTANNTRAAQFYKKSGWIDTGFTKRGDIRFEMSKETWQKKVG